jgi:hypothetical protein
MGMYKYNGKKRSRETIGRIKINDKALKLHEYVDAN